MEGRQIDRFAPEVVMQAATVAQKILIAIALVVFWLSAAASARAADTTPSSPPPAVGIEAAQLKIDSGDFRGAIPILTAYTKDHPNDADGLNLMGYSLRKTGQTDQALQYYNRALALNPKHPGVNEYLGELYTETGQIDKAREVLNRFKGSNAGGLDVNRIEETLSNAPTNGGGSGQSMPLAARQQLLQFALLIADRSL